MPLWPRAAPRPDPADTRVHMTSARPRANRRRKQQHERRRCREGESSSGRAQASASGQRCRAQSRPALGDLAFDVPQHRRHQQRPQHLPPRCATAGHRSGIRSGIRGGIGRGTPIGDGRFLSLTCPQHPHRRQSGTSTHTVRALVAAAAAKALAQCAPTPRWQRRGGPDRKAPSTERRHAAPVRMVPRCPYPHRPLLSAERALPLTRLLTPPGPRFRGQ